MTDAALEASLGAVQVTGFMGLFVPGIEKFWQADPEDGKARRELRTGELVYLFVVAVVGTMYSMKGRSVAPLVLSFAMALAVLAAFEYAFRKPPKAPA